VPGPWNYAFLPERRLALITFLGSLVNTTVGTQWDPDVWEDHVHALLTLRHGAGNYQRVPDDHGGDAGLEGFSRDGFAYQSYAAQGFNSIAQLYEKQRRKISADIKKFILNRERLSRILGTVRVRRWLLVVPEHTSAELVAHASAKTAEVLRADLPYVDPGFQIGVLTEADFMVERRQLAGVGAAPVEVEWVDVDASAVAAFAAAVEHSSLLRTMSEKLSRLPQMADASRKRKTLNKLLHGYLRGLAYKGQLAGNYPEIHRRYVDFKQRKEASLELQSLVTDAPLNNRLQSHISGLDEEIATAFPSLRPMASDLVTECIADWLMRCPLDFYRNTITP
jgi:hypothetical protein